MAQEIAVRSDMEFGQMQRLAEAVAKSRLFGIATADQALVLMAISQAEGRHPALAARDYDIIQGRPAKKAEAMMRDFLAAGGKVEWRELSDTVAEAVFSHPQGGAPVPIRWDAARAKQAGLDVKEMYKKYPRAMLRSRVVSEGVRTVYPAATSGFYVPEEVAEFREPKDVTPARDIAGDLDAFAATERVVKPDADTDSFLAVAERMANQGLDAYAAWFKSLSKANRQALAEHHAALKTRAATADAERADPFYLPPLPEHAAARDQQPSERKEQTDKLPRSAEHAPPRSLPQADLDDMNRRLALDAMGDGR